jgi:hypothetical protein
MTFLNVILKFMSLPKGIIALPGFGKNLNIMNTNSISRKYMNAIHLTELFPINFYILIF